MQHAQVRFEREGVEGAVPAGCSITETAKRLGVRLMSCEPDKGVHHCRVTITSGIDNVSDAVGLETEHFPPTGRSSNERLGCMTLIKEPGEIIIMTEESRENRETDTEHARAAAAGVGDIKSQFEALPLDKKFASLFQMELSTLNEAVKYVADSSMKVFEKFGDALSDLGTKVETEAKKAVEINKDEPTVTYTPPVVTDPFSDPVKVKTEERKDTDV